MITTNNDKIKTYTEAVARGDYDLGACNLYGKHDNVRTFWEDQLTRFVLRPFLTKLVEDRKARGEKTRIIDLGSGSGQGYELLTRIDKRDLDLGLLHDRALPIDEIESYLGLDISQPMVDKGNEIFRDEDNMRFIQGDLTNGLDSARDEKPFDLYFSSYGSFSHLSKESLQNLLTDICEHGNNESLVVLDLIGRYSIEWPQYWNAETEEEKVRDYSMNYLHLGLDYEVETEHFPIRFWTGFELDKLMLDINKDTKGQIEIVKKLDRSILVGRHTDTRLYNPRLQSTRRGVNCLHENYMRTDLSKLIIDHDLAPEHPKVSPFLNELIKSWNILVDFCNKRLLGEMQLIELENWSEFPSALQFSLMVIDRVITDTGWMWYGEPRANIIESQLGYALRNLESSMQHGLGCGHGLVAILKVTK